MKVCGEKNTPKSSFSIVTAIIWEWTIHFYREAETVGVRAEDNKQTWERKKDYTVVLEMPGSLPSS